jgi:hypothetical protein
MKLPGIEPGTVKFVKPGETLAQAVTGVKKLSDEAARKPKTCEDCGYDEFRVFENWTSFSTDIVGECLHCGHHQLLFYKAHE